MYQDELLTESAAHAQRFLSSNYFASENLVSDKTTSSLTWERVHAGYAPIGMLAFVDNAMTSATRRSTMVSCDAVISTLEEAMMALAADSTTAFGSLEREVVGDELIVDAEVLETLQQRTKERPDEYVGLKHVTYRSAVNLGNGAAGEDYVVVESQGRDVDPDGFAFAFKMLRSVDVPGVFGHVDSMPHKRNATYSNTNNNQHEMDSLTRRGNIHTFMVILSETKFTGVLRMQLWLDVDLPSNGNGVATPMDSSFATLHDALSLGLRYRRLIERYFASTVKKDTSSSISLFANINLMPMAKVRVSQCQVCERKLGLFKRTRHSCDVCKVSLCSTCAKTTDMCSWRLCACCYGRNHSLFSRQILSKMSPFSRISIFARRSSSSLSLHRQSIIQNRQNRKGSTKSNGPPMAATIRPFHPANSHSSSRTSSSESSSSTAASSSHNNHQNNNNPANDSMDLMGFQTSVGELIQISEMDDDLEEAYAPVASYTDPLPLDGLKLLDDSFIQRLSVSNQSWHHAGVDESDVDRFLERMSLQEKEEMAGRGRLSFQVL